jgi:LysR family nod box-dependent transcriptional activator
MRFKGLDLNLLVALNVLLEERSVSRAAQRLHLSQPAASAALARLRDFFGDELLILHGKRMIPTSYADSLVPEVRRVLGHIDTIISTSAEFDPSRSERIFRLMASDYIAAVLIGPAIQKLEDTAPGIQLDIQLPNELVALEFERGEIDLVLTPEEFLSPNHPSELLFEEQHVVVGWSGNPLMQRPLSEDQFRRSAHVAVALGPNRQPTYAERHLQSGPEGRSIEIVAPSFSAVPWLVIGTRRLTVMHERLARAFSEVLPLRFQPLPVQIPPMREMIQYHSARTHDTGVVWLRRLFHEMGARIDV